MLSKELLFMRKIILTILFAVLIAPAAHATTYINSFNTYNKYVTHKNLFKTEVVNQYVNDEVRRWDYGFYLSAPKLVAIPKADDLYFGIRFDGTGMFDRAVSDRYEVLVGFTYDGTLLNKNN